MCDVRIEPRRSTRREPRATTRSMRGTYDPPLQSQRAQIDRLAARQSMLARKRDSQHIVEQLAAMVANITPVWSRGVVHGDDDIQIATREPRETFWRFGLFDRQLHAWIRLSDVSERRHDESRYRRRKSTDRESSESSFLQCSELGARAFELGIDQRGVLEKQVRLRRESHATAIRGEKRRADVPAERSDLL